MKPDTGFNIWIYKMCWLVFAVTFLLAEPVLSLQMTKIPQNLQTKIKEPRERTISLKLPLLQPRFHWTFMSREDFLSGKLLLRIIRDGQSNDIVIFEKGRFSDGWEAMTLSSGPDKGEIYFGFISTQKYLTAPTDNLELELTVIKDLPGIGAIQTGSLPAKKYKSTGTYSWLIDEYDTTLLAEVLEKEGRMSPTEQETLLNKIREMYSHKAFLESWKEQWPLIITSEKGWLPEEKASKFKKTLEKSNTMKLDTPTGHPVKDKSPFQKYLCFWIIIPPVAVFIIIILRRAFTKI